MLHSTFQFTIFELGGVPSAKTGEGITEIFDEAIRAVLHPKSKSRSLFPNCFQSYWKSCLPSQLENRYESETGNK